MTKLSKMPARVFLCPVLCTYAFGARSPVVIYAVWPAVRLSRPQAAAISRPFEVRIVVWIPR